MTSPYLISRERFVPAPPESVFDLLARPAMHSVIDGSGTVGDARPNGPARLAPGAAFGMDMKMGVPYKIRNTVTEFDEGRRIAWRHSGGHVWRYLLEPADGGTLVTEQWDARHVRHRVMYRIMGVTRRHPESLEQTLEKLAEHFTVR
ncbi:SRPBCC family protein [Arthrobacter sp. ATA002]|uniref:SRPBCC family protein n=1 Tax=Arthrobacter sp. ATA002 TaxID=2991715 RepID=UPI0022A7025F|nr:SRPBCC family protein [Arthrobacter sp. ATA002]WAP52231.1 SRPBCC family protein [Arthrobacter sp. ATA002]